jgi:Redoxin
MPTVHGNGPFATLRSTAACRIGLRAMTTVAVVVALIAIAPTSGQDAAGGGDGRQLRPQERRLVDIDGSIHRPFDDPQVRAVVLVFVVPDCPISNAYLPELNRLHADYGPRGVRLFLVQVDPQLSVEGAREHAKEYRLRPPVVLDGRHAWVRKLGATVTPEAAVLSPAGQVLYLGRIDDRYPALGKWRAKVTSHDLRDALDAVLAGRPVPRPRTEAVGCDIPDVP